MVTEVLISLWAAVSLALYFVVITRMPEKLRLFNYQPFNRKPFNCEACLPFWLFAAFLPFAIYRYNGELLLIAIAGCCSSGIITSILTSWIKRQ